MLGAIGSAIPIAIGIAISPIALAAFMIVLISPRARVNAPTFLLGWLLGILIVGLLAYFIPGMETSRDKPGQLAGIVRLVLGLTLLFLALRQYRSYATSGKAKSRRFLNRIVNMNKGHCLLIGLLLTAGHPKNLPLIVAGVAAIARYNLDTFSELLTFLIFAIAASSTLAVPMAVSFAARNRSEIIFSRWKNWLIEKNDIIVLILLVIFGMLLVGRGLKILTA